jgi:predicted RNase H-like nuclease (RuvC/YqgF family)
MVSGGTRSIISRRTVVSGNGSIRTSKTYISHLERQLKDEKDAREKLAREIEEIKRINSEISSKLGLSTQPK